MWPNVTPLPVPSGSVYSFDNTFIGFLRSLLENVERFLASIPVVPNPLGLYDNLGRWLPPVVSMLDMLITLAVSSVLVVMVLRLSPGHTSISSVIGRSAKSSD